MESLYTVRLAPAFLGSFHSLPRCFHIIQIDRRLEQACRSFLRIEGISDIGSHAGFFDGNFVIRSLYGIDGIAHSIAHLGMPDGAYPDIRQSDELLRHTEHFFIAVQQPFDMAFTDKALIHCVMGNGIDQLALMPGFLK